MNEKVYVLIENYWDDKKIKGIFKDKKQAEEMIEIYGPKRVHYHVEEHYLIDDY